VRSILPSRRWRGLVSSTLVLMLAVGVPLAALASDVDVAVVDVTAPTGSVSLAPGGSGPITINMSVTGNQAGTATFTVNRDWTLSGGTFTGSTPQTFTVPPRSGGDPATTFSTSGTVTVAAGHGTGTFTLAVGAFDITNSNATGAKLAARNVSNYQVTVTAPPPPANSPPTVDANGPYSGTEGSPIALTGAASDPNGDTLIYAWSFQAAPGVDAGASCTFSSETVASPSVTCTDDGTYTLTLSVSDGKIASPVTDTATLTVSNAAPTVSFTSPATSANEGDTKTYSFTVSDAGTNDTFSVTSGFPNCGTGGSLVPGSVTTTTTGGSFQCLFPDGPASPSVSIQVTDDDGAVSTAATTSVTVANVDPTATLGNNGPVNEGSSATISFTSPSDPSSTDTAAGFHYAFSCTNGDLSGATYANSGTSASTNCPFADNGSFTVKGRIIDKDGGYTEYTTSVTVNNVKPTVSLGTLTGTGIACIGGNQVGLPFSFSDPGVNDGPWTVTINWGDGSTATTFSASTQGAQSTQPHTYAAGGPYTITVTVKDKDNATSDAQSPAAFSLKYNTSGLLQPINADKSSNFKAGSVFPIKIQITDCNGASVGTLKPDVKLEKVGAGGGVINEAEVVSVPDDGSEMRYDTSGKQYIYNLSTKRSTLIAPAGPIDIGSYKVSVLDPAITTADGYFDVVK